MPNVNGQNAHFHFSIYVYILADLRNQSNAYNLQWNDISLDHTWVKSMLWPPSAEVDCNMPQQALNATKDE